jgi:hypothetical protein
VILAKKNTRTLAEKPAPHTYLRTHSMNLATLRLTLAALVLATAAHVSAQPASATFRPALIESFATSYSFTTESDLSRGPVVGTVSVHHFDLSVTGRTPLSETTMLLHGLAYAHHAFDAGGAARLPDSLSEAAISLGVQHRIDARWSLAAYLRPGFYGDFETLDSDSFNAPLLATAVYSVSRELSWIFGFSANAFSDNPIFPIAGVRWQYAPAWTLNIGFPRAGVTYQHSEQLALSAGATVQGGDYRISGDLGVPAPGLGRLADTYLEYREIRLGLAAELKLSGGVALTADAGFTVDQRFDYNDRGYRLEGDAVPFFALAVKGRF